MNTDLYVNLIYAMAVLAASAAVVPLAAKWRKLAGWLNFGFVSAAAVFLLNISYDAIINGISTGATQIDFGFANIHFLIDPFSGFFIAVIAFMSMVSAFYSISYMDHYHDYSLRGYYFLYPLFILGMILIVTVDDLSLGFTIAWQMMTVTSFLLVRFESKKEENVRNANKYFIWMQIAWVIILGGVFLINGSSVGDSVHTLTEKLGNSGSTAYFIYALLLIGFGFKAGVFPLGQLWLPDAHSVAPSPISALLSGVMIKTGVYGIIRTFFWMTPHSGDFHYDPAVWGIIISSIGVVTLFIGTVQSMKQNDSKRLLAYSSIGQVGYIVLAIGVCLYLVGSDSKSNQFLALIAIVGALYHVLNHAFFKGLLFLTSGSVLYATGTKDLNKLGGLLKLMPVTGIIAAIASLSISGVPPFSGFASKWTIISTSIIAGSETAFLVIFGIIALFTSAVTLSCYVKFFGMTFTSAGTEWTMKTEAKEVSPMMLLPKIVLTVLCIVQGLIPYFYFNQIANIFASSSGSIIQDRFRNASLDLYVGSPFMGVDVSAIGIAHGTTSAAVPGVILLVVAVAMLAAWLFKRSGNSAEREADTWLCGYQEHNNLNRYQNKSMFSSFKKALWWTGGNVKE